MRAVAVLLSLSLVACFPNNARHRTFAKIAEGGLVAGGIAILAVSNTQADCDLNSRPGMSMDCKSSRGFVSGLGLALIVAGMVGFFATVTTEPDDKTVSAKPAAPTTAPPSTTPTPIAP